MGLYGDSLTVRRMRASGVVIFAAVLTTLVASALAATFAVYSGGVLPRAVRHDLATATGTTFLVTGPVDHDQASQVTRDLPGQLKRALGPVPFRFALTVYELQVGAFGLIIIVFLLVDPDGLVGQPHRVEAVQGADWFVVMENGRVLREGKVEGDDGALAESE